MSYYGNFNLAIKHLYSIANRAMLELLKKGRTLFLDVEVMLKLYGSEVWGYSNLDYIEKLEGTR